MIYLIIAGVLAALAALTVVVAAAFRTVVATNDVHIVQSRKRSTVYGKDQSAGNVYYCWPHWLPWLGVRTISLPVSNFPVRLDGYEAYDKGRLPFQVDVMAFFRVEDPVMAAQRISDFGQLRGQLEGILQGACRTILAKAEIEQILEGRSEFGEQFTKEVDENLANWGVRTVKTIEFMDIRDSEGSEVIHQIMAKKKSEIEKDSRIAVANNTREAELAEVAATQLVDVRKYEAAQAVGVRKAEAEQQVGISTEKSKQNVAEEAAITAEKNMAVKKVNDVRAAEIARDVKVVAAEQEKKHTIIVAEGKLEQAKLNAEGVRVEGEAKGQAEQAILMAPVNTQISLAKEIGQNQGYQDYLIRIRVVEKDQVVGVEQAKALQAADIKVIANTGEVSNGVDKVMDLFSSKGGTAIGAALEALKQTPAGAELLSRVAPANDKAASAKKTNGHA